MWIKFSGRAVYCILGRMQSSWSLISEGNLNTFTSSQWLDGNPSLFFQMKMLCYLLRWPDDRVSFLSVHSIEELRDQLEDLGDTSQFTAQEITDPVFLTFVPTIKSHTDG